MDAPSPASLLDRAARVGFTVKGLVYILIAVLSARAVSAGRDALGPAEVIEALLDAPFNEVLLAAVGIGLGCYGLWRLVGAALFPADAESGAKGWTTRLAYAATGTVHLGFGGYALYLALGYDRAGGGAEQTLTERAMALPGGVWAVGLLGIVFFAVAAFQVREGFFRDPLGPHRTDQMSDAERRGARHVAKLGLGARGVVFATIGLFLVLAAWRADPGEVGGLGDALGALAGQPYGGWVFALVALGLVAYGVYCFSLARYARFPTALGEGEGDGPSR